MLDFITDAKFFRISFIAPQPVVMYLINGKMPIQRLEQVINMRVFRLHLVFALKQVSYWRQEGCAEVEVPDRRSECYYGQEVGEDSLVIESHGLVDGY